ncbi:MAG: fibronectin type III domain-containing protein [Candidatus Falkowbacteria bacterium]
MVKQKFVIINLVIFLGIISSLTWACWHFVPSFWSNHDLIFTEVTAAETPVEVDKTPPLIANVKIDSITPTSTTISWLTNKNSDSLINYNVSRDYGMVRSPSLTTTHQLIIPELSPSQLYYYRIISVDQNGNQSISNDFSFNTEDLPGPTSTEPVTPDTPTKPGEAAPGAGEGTGLNVDFNGTAEEAELIKQTLKMIEGISSEQGLSLIESKLQSMAEEKAKPPVISGDFAKVEVGVDYATITWKTDKESNSMVAFATDGDYAPNSTRPYNHQEGDPNTMVTVHQVKIIGLLPATTYHYQVLSKSSLDLESASDDNTFRTKSILPEIFNINLGKVEETAATIDFSTNVPCSAIIEYTDRDTNVTKLEGSTALVNVHSIRIKDLKFDTYYSAVIKVENEQGEKAISEPIDFATVRDVLPPVISKVNSESTLYPGTENKTQTIISWRTDEPTVCQFNYNKGIGLNEKPTLLTKEEDYGSNHVQVVTDFQSATVYKFWLECFDRTGNKARSQDYTMLTPAREESILDLIIKNFEGTFGWLKKK